MSKTFDVKCLDLARSFISDTSETPAHQETLAVILASEIQQAIEDFMEERGLSI